MYWPSSPKTIIFIALISINRIKTTSVLLYSYYLVVEAVHANHVSLSIPLLKLSLSTFPVQLGDVVLPSLSQYRKYWITTSIYTTINRTVSIVKIDSLCFRTIMLYSTKIYTTHFKLIWWRFFNPSLFEIGNRLTQRCTVPSVVNIDPKVLFAKCG